jgi:hypothetical protein
VYSILLKCCLEAEEDLEYFNEEFYVSDCPDRLPVELWCLFAAVFRVYSILSFVKEIIHVIIILYYDIGYYVSIFCTVCIET